MQNLNKKSKDVTTKLKKAIIKLKHAYSERGEA